MEKKKGFKGRLLVLVLSLALLSAAGAGGTLAWLAAKTTSAVNTFEAGKVSCAVKEDFNGTTKSNVSVTNTGNVPAYIRVALVPTWEDAEGNVVAQQAGLADLDITRDTTNWFKASDGYYYCKAPVAAGGNTPVLISSATVKTESEYHMNLQILAEAIQADPADAVQDAWGAVKVSGGNLTTKG